MALGVWTRDLITPPETTHPAAPWRAQAEAWLGFFRSDRPATLPAGLCPLLGKRTRAVALARYLPGSTLVYDELIIATPALLGAQPGFAIEYIWVDSLASLWGGRRIWGLPKEMADFTWSPEGVQVTDAAGPILSLGLRARASGTPTLPFATASIGRIDLAWAYAIFPLRARFALAEMNVRQWSPRFDFAVAERPSLAFAMTDCRITFAPGRLIRG